MGPLVGQPLLRKEDARLVTGHGTYVDNVKLPGMAYLAMVRSPTAHARIRGIDSAPALAVPGVLAVLAAADLPPITLDPFWLVPNADLKTPPRPVIAADTVRYVGEIVAVVVAASLESASDAAELVEVDYGPLPVVIAARDALEPGAPQLHQEAPGNQALRYRFSAGDVDAAFRDAAVVTRLAFINQRIAPAAIEGRAAAARYDEFAGELTAWLTSQGPHAYRSMVAGLVGLPDHKVRLIAPDVGGGFGGKAPFYPEDAIVCYLTKHLRRPVKWAGTRREDMQTTIHARDQVSDMELAADAAGHLLALRGVTYANVGAYLSGFGAAIPTVVYASALPGAYRLPALAIDVRAAFTNTAPTDAYRGAGSAMGIYAIERMMDALADDLGLDPAEVRRRNLVGADQFPWDSITGVTYDSGNYERALDLALTILDYEAIRREQARLRAEGRYIGVGLATFVERAGMGPSRIVRDAPSWIYRQSSGAGAGYETAHVRVTPGGRVLVGIGASPHGQGVETTFAQIVADQLGVAVEDVEILHGDTATTPYGLGTYASRTAVVSGSAVVRAAGRVQEKARQIAAHLLEAAVDDIDLSDGLYGVRGSPGHGKTFAEIAAAAYGARDLPPGMEPALEANAAFDPENYVFPFGTHACVVEVDPETGDLRLLRYVAVDDCGVQINPLVVEGQVHGAVTQGMAQALWEAVAYDDAGQLVTGSFMEYAVPKADMLPGFETASTVTPAPSNPLGVKGVGEAGTIAATPTVVNAVVDALSHLGVRHLDMPLTPERVWRAIRGPG